MPILLLFIVIKIAFVFLFFIFGAVLAIELLPAMAHWAVTATLGTPVAEVGAAVSNGIMWIAQLAERFLDFMIQFLGQFGLDISSVKTTAKDVGGEVGKEAGKIDKPKF